MRNGSKHSEETKKKISLSNKGRISPMKGKHHSEETKKKMSEFFKGHKLSEETKRKLSLSLKGRISPLRGRKQSKKIIEKRRKSILKWYKNEDNRNTDAYRLRLKRISRANKGRKHSLQFKEKLRKANLGKKLSKKTKLKISLATKGKKFSTETREKLSIANLGKKRSEKTKRKMSELSIKKWQSLEYRKKVFKTLNKRPTSYEKKIIKLCKKHSLPFKYVGNKSLIINKINPDFIATDGTKRIIEVYCVVWHPKDYEKIRAQRFAINGYKTLFINDKDIKDNSNWENLCLNKIKNFRRGNI